MKHEAKKLSKYRMTWVEIGYRMFTYCPHKHQAAKSPTRAFVANQIDSA